jgi:hypothetical protein
MYYKARNTKILPKYRQKQKHKKQTELIIIISEKQDGGEKEEEDIGIPYGKLIFFLPTEDGELGLHGFLGLVEGPKYLRLFSGHLACRAG